MIDDGWWLPSKGHGTLEETVPMLVSIKRVLIFGAAAMFIPASVMAVDGA